MRRDIRKERSIMRKIIFLSILLGILVGGGVLYFYKNKILALISIFVTVIVAILFYIVRKNLKKTARIKKIEEVFPDFLQLMSSNLRAGMTIDRSILLSSRPEFAPLDAEILQTGKNLTTGKNVEISLLDMSKRLHSEKIHKTILLINSGIRAGGDLAILLEQTAVSMRERKFVEKKAASSVMMYVIFIFLAVSIFAPALFSLSTVLVEVLTNILAGLPSVDTSVNMPFTLSKINISISFIKYFSIIFMITIDIFASMVLGLVGKGDEKQGLRYLPIIVIMSISIYFLARIFISRFLGGLL
jgi:pilus assembly protein TadC